MNRGGNIMSYSSEVIHQCAAFHTGKVHCPGCTKCGSGSCFSNCLDYRQGNVPNYGCDNLRYAYVLKYFYVHKAETFKLLVEEKQDLRKHLKLSTRQSKLNYAGIGAGPGSDFIGFVEWLQDNKLSPNLKLQCVRMDKEDNWITQFKLIRGIYQPLLDELGVEVAYRKVIGDIFDVSPTKNLDVLSFSYIISELISNNKLDSTKKRFEKLWNRFSGRLNKKSVIILNDRPEQEVASFFDFFADIVKDSFPKSNSVNYSFCSNLNFGTNRFDRHCGESYPDDLCSRYGPKLLCNSCQTLIYIDKE